MKTPVDTCIDTRTVRVRSRARLQLHTAHTHVHSLILSYGSRGTATGRSLPSGAFRSPHGLRAARMRTQHKMNTSLLHKSATPSVCQEPPKSSCSEAIVPSTSIVVDVKIVVAPGIGRRIILTPPGTLLAWMCGTSFADGSMITTILDAYLAYTWLALRNPVPLALPIATLFASCWWSTANHHTTRHNPICR